MKIRIENLDDDMDLNELEFQEKIHRRKAVNKNPSKPDNYKKKEKKRNASSKNSPE
jgi:hypothetical protein